MMNIVLSKASTPGYKGHRNKWHGYIYPDFKMLSLLIFALVAAIWVYRGEAGASEPVPVLRIGSEVEFPPFAMVDENGEPAGFSVDLIKAVADAMGIPVTFTTGPWDTVWNGLVSGSLDVLPIAAMSPERQRLIDFSLPHTETFDAFFVSTGKNAIPNIKAAQGKEIVVMRSDAAHHVLEVRNFQGKLVLVDTIPDGLSIVASGRHDAFLCSKLIGTLAMKKHDIKGLAAGPIIPDYKRVFAFGIRNGDVELREKLNQGLMIVKSSGEYRNIYDKWLTISDPWAKYQKIVLIALSMVAVIAIGAFVWSLLLGRAVKKKIQDELQRITREQRIILDTANIAVSLVQHRKQVWINRKTEEMFQYSAEEMVNHTTRKLYPSQEAYDRMGANAYPVLATGATYETVQELVRRDGSHIWVKYNGKAIDPPNMSAGTLWLLEDITERKEMEESLRRAYEELEQRVADRTKDLMQANVSLHQQIAERKKAEESQQKSENHFRNTFEQAAVGMSILSPSGVWMQINHRLCEILGYSQDELMKMNFSDITYPDHIDGDVERVRQMENGVRNTDSWEKRYIRKDGQVIWARITTSLSRSEDGTPQYFVAVTEDITEQVHQRQQIMLLNRLYNVLSQVSQAVVRAASPQPFFEESCRVIVDAGGLMMAWIGYVEKETNRVIPASI